MENNKKKNEMMEGMMSMLCSLHCFPCFPSFHSFHALYAPHSPDWAFRRVGCSRSGPAGFPPKPFPG